MKLNHDPIVLGIRPLKARSGATKMSFEPFGQSKKMFHFFEFFVNRIECLFKAFPPTK